MPLLAQCSGSQKFQDNLPPEAKHRSQNLMSGNYMVLDPQAHKETENCSGELQQINAFSCPKFDFKNIKYRPKSRLHLYHLESRCIWYRAFKSDLNAKKHPLIRLVQALKKMIGLLPPKNKRHQNQDPNDTDRFDQDTSIH